MITVNNDEKLITVNEKDVNLLVGLLEKQIGWNRKNIY